MRLTGRAVLAGALLVPLDLVERCHQRPRAAAGQAHDAIAAADDGLELEEGFGGLRARARCEARRRAGAIERKPGRFHRPRGGKRFRHRAGAADSLDVPGQRENVAPVAVGLKQGVERGIVGPSECALELREPGFDRRAKRLCLGHALDDIHGSGYSAAVAALRRFSTSSAARAIASAR
jgi:hypothetical protein